jgi:hypothetical protein
MMPTLLFTIYAIHLAIFGLLWWRRRQGVYGVLTVTFVLLILSYGLRVYTPEARIGSLAAYWPPRVASWIGVVTGLTLLVVRRLRRRATH